MLKCIAIDDEELALELLEDNINKVPFLDLKASFSNPLEAIPFLQAEPIDLIFLDIQMPGLTGLQFIESFPVNAMCILITAYEKYALEGYNLNVVDYLVKPVALDRFVKACNKALELAELKSQNRPTVSPVQNDYLFVNQNYSLVKIEKKEITWIEGLKDYVKIHLKNSNRPIVTRISLKTLEDELSTGFIRIHKSYIISIGAIKSVKKTSILIENEELPLSEAYRDKLYHAIGKNL